MARSGPRRRTDSTGRHRQGRARTATATARTATDGNAPRGRYAGLTLLAADLHREHKLATADAIVYATARHMGAGLLTCDAHFEGLPDVALFPKSA